MTDKAAPAVDPAHLKLFLGHPRGLGFLTFAESWERFSFSGMQALLVLYMGQQLLLPGHVEHVAGFAGFRHAIEQVYGHLSTQALASVVFGLYSGGVYLTPIAGGYIADRLLGRTRTVVIGALLLMAGHFLMAFEQPFLVALACLVAGVGCFKGNIATQVGELYAPGDLRRADAFQIYIIGISCAATVAPLVCGTLGQGIAWHWGFGAAGVGMLASLAVYLRGQRWTPEDHQPRAAAKAPRRRLAPGEGRTVLLLLALLPALALSLVGNEQMFNTYLVWGEQHYDLRLMGHAMPVTWLLSLTSIIAIACMSSVVVFWRYSARWWGEVDEITKLVIGCMVSATAPLLLAALSAREAATGHRIGLAWALAFHFLNEIGIANVVPVGLALFTRVSPKAVGGLMVGVYYLHMFASNMLVGWLGGLLEKMSATDFWLLHAGLVAGGGLALLLSGLLFGRLLKPAVDPELIEVRSPPALDDPLAGTGVVAA